MKTFIFTVSDKTDSYARIILIRDVEDLSCGLAKLDAKIRDNEVLTEFEEV